MLEMLPVMHSCHICKKFTFMHCSFFSETERTSTLGLLCKVSDGYPRGFMIEICSLSEKESEHMTVNFYGGARNGIISEEAFLVSAVIWVGFIVL